jgi:hypothetical protein
MKRGSTIFLRVVILLIAAVAFAGMILFPLTEGRAVNLDLYSIYSDPFIIYAYVASVPFFVALYQAFKLLGYIGRDKVLSQNCVKALQTIRYCAIAIAGFIVVGEVWLIITMSGKDDIDGPNALGIFMAFATVVIATAAGIFEKLLQSAMDMKSENEKDCVNEDHIYSNRTNTLT